MAQPGSIQVQVPSWISRGSRFRNSFDWLVATYGTRTGDRLTTVQMRNICDSQAVPQACRATLKHQVSGLSWYLSKDEEGDEPLKEADDKGKHYYTLLRNWMDDEGHIVGFASGVDLLTDDILTAREGGCCEVIRDKAGVAQYVLKVDAATVRFTHDRKRPVYQVSPWGEVTEAWEADRFMQVRWHPSPKIGAALLNRTPVQLSYSAIAILAGADTYNWKLITEPIPAGILNLGPGFNTAEKAKQWKASWDASMQGINPEVLAVIYGTPNLQYIPFRPPPKDMAFETTDHWYASLVAACYEMSILDISILTRVATKAAAEEQAEATKRQGLRQLMRKVKLGIENYILEDGIFFHFEDIDPTDEKVEADIASKNTDRVVQMVQAKMLTEEQGVKVLQQWKHIPDDVKYDAAEFEKRKEEAQEQFKAKGEKGGEEEEQKEKGGEEEKEEKKTEKSFPGHKGRPGKVGGSLPRGVQATVPKAKGRIISAYFETGHGKKLVEGLSEAESKSVIAMLTLREVRPEYLEGLKGITTEPHPDEPHWGLEQGGKQFFGGLYDRNTGMLHMHSLSRPSKLFMHELGHHIMWNSSWQDSEVGKRAKIVLYNSFKRAKKEGTGFKYGLRDMGLRDYSLTSVDEFQADCWMVYHLGAKKQKAALARYIGVNNMEDLFGPKASASHLKEMTLQRVREARARLGFP